MYTEIYNYEPLWGSWKIEELIGSGSIGKVYKISKIILDKKYYSAVKFITISSEQYNTFDLDPSAENRYLDDTIKNIANEIDLLYKLKGHTNIITYEDHMIERSSNFKNIYIFIRMEYAHPLTKYAQENTLCENDVIKIGLDICDALITCHNNGIMHRDIKEANIFRSKLGNYKLGDFGVSKYLDTTNAQTRIGTIYYIPPEILKGTPYNKTVDIYSLGIVLYKLLNMGRLPFMPGYPTKFTQRDVENSQAQRFAGEIFTRPALGSDELVKIIFKACSFKPVDRYQSAVEMKNDLLKLVNCTSFDNATSKSKKQQLHNTNTCSSYFEHTASFDTVQNPIKNTTQQSNTTAEPNTLSSIQNLDPKAKNSPRKLFKKGIFLFIFIGILIFILHGFNLLPFLNFNTKNVIENSGAEVSDQSWKINSSSSSKGASVFTNDMSHHGNKSFKVEQFIPNDYTEFLQTVKIEKDKSYTFSGYVYSASVFQDLHVGAYLQIYYIDSENSKSYLNHPIYTKLNSWIFTSYQFTVPKSATDNKIYASFGIKSAPGIVYFDDLSIEPTKPR